MKTKLLILSFLLITGMVWGQVEENKIVIYDSERKSNAVFDSLNYPIKQYHDILSLHDPILYLGIAPYFAPAKERIVSLDNQEGKNGYWLEGNMNFRFLVYKGFL